MQRIWLSVISLVLFSSLYAQQSNFVLFSENNEPFTLLFNGARVNQMPTTNIKVTGLQASTARFKIICNSVPICDMDDVYFGIAADDRWDGHQAQRSEIAHALEKMQACDCCPHTPCAENNYCEPCRLTGEKLPSTISALF